MEFKTYVEGLKQAKFPDALRKTCFIYGLELKMEKESGWFTETVYFTVNGEEFKINLFKRWLLSSIQEYNNQ